MLLREYRPSDCEEMAKLFYDTVHTVNVGDYTNEQLNAWADGKIDLEKWDKSFREHYTVLAVCDGIITGFGDLDKSGYLDRLYVHKDYQRKGIAAAICDVLEERAKGEIVTASSITAKPFFAKRGYEVVRKQEVERHGILLTNYIMILRK